MISANDIITGLVVIGVLAGGGAVGGLLMMALDWLGRLVFPRPYDPYA